MSCRPYPFFFRILGVVTVLIMLCLSTAEAKRPQKLRAAPVSRNLKKYIRARHAAGIQGTLNKRFGYIPEPAKPRRRAKVRAMLALPLEVLPPSYDLRAAHPEKINPIRDQGECGSCWTFATMASLESSATPDGFDGSENNLKNKHGFSYGSCAGGNAFMSAAYLARWSGAVTEESDPYNPSSSWSPSGLSTSKHLREMVIIPDRTGALDNTPIKSAIMSYGAIFSTYFHDTTHYNAATKAYYYAGTANSNHAIGIIGWNDNYSRDNFRSPPPGDGAFLIRNSWGASWGDSGYFYISYYDSRIGTSNITFLADNRAANEQYDAIYQHDLLGFTNAFGYTGSDTAWFANVFSADAEREIAAAGWYSLMPGSRYELYLYLNPPAGAPLQSGSSPATVKSGTLTNMGYHIIDFDTPVHVSANQRFSIVVKLTTPGYQYPIPAEGRIYGYSDAAQSSPGESYVSGNGLSWSDLYDIFPNTNVSLKAFAGNAPTRTPTETPVAQPSAVATPPAPDPTATPRVRHSFSCSLTGSASCNRRHRVTKGKVCGFVTKVRRLEGNTLAPGASVSFMNKTKRTKWTKAKSGKTNMNGTYTVKIRMRRTASFRSIINGGACTSNVVQVSVR